MSDPRRYQWKDLLIPAAESLEDAHQSWHDAADSYHEPRNIRRHIDHLVQALRNVTFRLQANKRDIRGFDEWYPEWVSLMRNDPRMLWLKDARTEIVKRSGIQRTSRASLRLVASYLEHPRTLVRLPATMTTQRMIEKVRREIPEEYRPYAAIEIQRLWEVPDFPNQDLLLVLAYCYHVLESLLVFAHEVISEESKPCEVPEEFIGSVQWPPCMAFPPSMMTLLIAADTGNFLSITETARPTDETAQRQSAEEYGLLGLELSSDPIECGKQMHDVARRMFKRDGYHFPVLLLHHPEAGWGPVTALSFEDRRDKYIIWHSIAREVAYIGYDAFVFTSEAWDLPVSAVDPEGVYPPDFGEHPEREEVLVTHVETSEGRVSILQSSIVRFLDKAYLKRAREIGDAGSGFSRPIRKVWRHRRDRDEEFTYRTSASHGNPGID